VTKEEWLAEGERRFGTDKRSWKFKCPACGYVASVGDYMEAKAPPEAIAFSCIGRWLPDAREALGKGPGPCNYAGGGLFKANPVEVEGERYFEFA